MIVDDLDLHRAFICPNETYSPLDVDSYAVLTGAVTAQRFESVRRWYTQV